MIITIYFNKKTYYKMQIMDRSTFQKVVSKIPDRKRLKNGRSNRKYVDNVVVYLSFLSFDGY